MSMQFLGGVVQAFLEQGLAALLKERGVEEGLALQRARDTFARTGPGPVQTAMLSTQEVHPCSTAVVALPVSGA